MTKVLWGFPGIGKSSISNNENVMDVDYNLFQWKNITKEQLHSFTGSYEYNPDFPQNYIDFVNSSGADIVLVNCHISLLEHFDNVILFYPDISLKDEYLQRYQERGDHNSFISHMDLEFEGMIHALEHSSYQKYKVQEKGVFLEHLLNRKEILLMFMTKADIVDLCTKGKELFQSVEYKKTHCDILDAYQFDEITDFEKFAQSLFDGSGNFNRNIFTELETDIERARNMIAKEMTFIERRGGLSHQELTDKIMQGIVNGALGIRYAEIAPYSHGYEVTFGNTGKIGSTQDCKNRWECYSDFFDIGNIIAGKIEAGKQDNPWRGQCKELHIEEILEAIERREQEKITSFTPEKDTDFRRRKGYDRGDVATVMDVHAGKGLDGIVKHHYHGTYETMTPVSENNLVETLVYMNGFCLDFLDHLDIGPDGRNQVINYLKGNGIDISTPDKLEEWILKNPEKCAKEENRIVRKSTLEDQIKNAGQEVKTPHENRVKEQEKER